MHMNMDHIASGHFVLGETLLMAIGSMPPTKVCLQFKAAVPVRRKTCERCNHSLSFDPNEK